MTATSRVFVGAVLAAWCAVANAGAQAPVTIRVRVIDSVRAPIENADISIVRGLNVVLATGPADRRGERVFRVDAQASELQVVVRKVGYTRHSQFAHVEDVDSVTVSVVLARAPQQLAAVNITAPEEIRRRRQFIDEDAIAASDRPLENALDIVMKLRPDMVWGVRGPPTGFARCDPLTNLWVNGRLVRDVPTDFMLAARQREARMARRGSRSTPGALAAIPLDALSILGSIKPEHIEAMEYHDCTDLSIDKARGTSAMFVVLKAGVEFEPGVGTFVPDTPKKLPLKVPAATAQLIEQAEPYRRRLLGVFDADSGAPIVAADVTEVATGTKAVTTLTGTVSLAFMRDGGGSLVLSKSGYGTITVAVSISPRDTVPLTLVLHRNRE